MTITKSAVAALFAAGAFLAAPVAGADDTSTQTIGEPGKLVNGDVIQSWTISDLKPSSDPIPHTGTGTLWEATATNEAVAGSVIPIISNLNARTASGESYRALFQVATPQGMNPSGLAQGQKATGKVYFDVTGATPDSVVYNAGGEDLLVWVKPAPAPAAGSPSAPAATPGAPAATPAAPAPAAAPAPVAGSQGTPLPEGAPAAPVPTGSQGTPLPAGTEPTATPAPAATPTETPAPTPPPTETPGPVAGSQGTPLPADAPTAAPAATPAPVPAEVAGTPHGPQQAPAAAPATTTAPVPAPIHHGPPAS